MRDGLHWTALPLPPLWLAARGVWSGVLAYAAAAVAILGLAWALLLPGFVTACAFLALHLFFASEADEMQRAHLASQGWSMIGQVSGGGPLECERRFYDQWLPSVPMSSDVRTATPVSSTPTRTDPVPMPAAAQRSPRAILGNLFAPKRPS